MDKINCDVIRDLIPSYADDICSAATRRLVEEHIAGCSECKMAAALCRDHTLSGDKLDRQYLDGLKKVKQRLKLLDISSFCTLLLVIPLGIWLFAIRKNPPSESVQMVLYLLCLFLNLIGSITCQGKKPPQKSQYLLGAISIVIDAGIVLALYLIPLQLLKGADSFFLPTSEVGPLMARWMAAGFILQIVFYFLHFLLAVRQNIDCNWLLCLNVMGMFLILQCHERLYSMEPYDNFMGRILSETLPIIGFGFACSLICFLLTQYLRKRIR